MLRSFTGSIIESAAPRNTKNCPWVMLPFPRTSFPPYQKMSALAPMPMISVRGPASALSLWSVVSNLAWERRMRSNLLCSNASMEKAFTTLMPIEVSCSTDAKSAIFSCALWLLRLSLFPRAPMARALGGSTASVTRVSFQEAISAMVMNTARRMACFATLTIASDMAPFRRSTSAVILLSSSPVLLLAK
ncbi:MAG: hypothetical protein BWX47_02112 [candidate division Hyd24-12 bacterium ADurb.Bin004]|nr:MAG: hypothetical protein BWX47_02112 [candidate division Hyd24-12 bacterium ADurb.Bin004]